MVSHRSIPNELLKKLRTDESSNYHQQLSVGVQYNINSSIEVGHIKVLTQGIAANEGFFKTIKLFIFGYFNPIYIFFDNKNKHFSG